MDHVSVELLASNKTYKPVLLEITSVNPEEGKGTCVNVYAGFMSHKHIYARLASDVPPSKAYPEYIRVKRGKTCGTENYRYITEHDFSAIIRNLECTEGTTLSEDKRVRSLSEDEPAISIINQLWPASILSHSLSPAS